MRDGFSVTGRDNCKYDLAMNSVDRPAQILAASGKFLAFFFLTTIVCCIVWGNTAANLYDIDDPFLPAYLEPGGWAVAWGGHPVMTVARIVHAHPMGWPNTIKEDWSFADLWALWWSFCGFGGDQRAPDAS